MDAQVKEEHCIESMPEGLETTCWGCGLRLLLASYTPTYRCGWCGAITNQTPREIGLDRFHWRRLRDRCFVSIIVFFMLFVICGGVWAAYPVVFAASFFGILNLIITTILSICTLSSFILSAFCAAGVPPSIPWGSYPLMGKGALEDYTFCLFCSRPKSPRTHHCHSCGTCVLDMDHHCPFIGNCVGSGNHRYFIMFLFSAVLSTLYVCILSAYAVFHLWPPLDHGFINRLNPYKMDTAALLRLVLDILLAFLYTTSFISSRELVLVYLCVAGLSVTIGLSVLLGQQLVYIYEGNTYLSNLSSKGDGASRRDCQNLFRFFGCSPSTSRLFSIFPRSKKPHKK